MDYFIGTTHTIHLEHLPVRMRDTVTTSSANSSGITYGRVKETCYRSIDDKGFDVSKTILNYTDGSRWFYMLNNKDAEITEIK